MVLVLVLAGVAAFSAWAVRELVSRGVKISVAVAVAIPTLIVACFVIGLLRHLFSG